MGETCIDSYHLVTGSKKWRNSQLLNLEEQCHPFRIICNHKQPVGLTQPSDQLINLQLTQNLYLLIEEIHQLIVYPTFWKVEVLHPRAFNINHHHQPSHPPILRSTPFQVTPGDTNRPDLEGHVCVRSHRYKWLPVSAQKSPRKGRGLNVTVFVQRFQRGVPRGEACERFP